MQSATIDVLPQLEEWGRMKRFVESFCKQNNFSEQISLSLQLACEEWFINTVVHGFKKGAAQTGDPPFIRLSINVSRPDEIVVQLIDNAPYFNPLEHPVPDVTLPAEDRSIGGLGIYLMLKQADHSSYRRLEGRNELTLHKKVRDSMESESERCNGDIG